MLNISFRSIVLSGFVLMPLNIANAAEYAISAGLMRFDYTEFDTSGVQLDRETGWIPGIDFKYVISSGEQFGISAGVSRYDGMVDYNGQTQTGVPHITRTDETIDRIGARVSMALSPETELFGSQHYLKWQRDIRNNNGVFGLFEEYTWWETAVGVKSQIWQQDREQLFFELGLLHIFQPEIFIDLSRFNGGSTTLQLEEKAGIRIRLEWLQHSSETLQYGFTSWLEYWKFGRSNTGITQGGAPNFFVTEPDSETRHIGIQFTIINRF